MRQLDKMDYNLPKIPLRPQNSNKGTFGKILNISGSKYMRGAAYLSSISALKTGAGYVELASDEKVLDTVSVLAPEVVLAPIGNLPQLIKNATVISIGCGLSTTQQAQKIFDQTLSLRDKNQPLVIDADGLNILSQRDLELDSNVILTPHPKEASRLLNCSLDDILSDMEISALEICKKYKCITVLKSHKTIVTNGLTIYKNITGNSALAKAGSGDVLCGIITGLLAQKMSIFDSACLGVYLHGLSGEIASKDLSEYGVLASDLLRYIPYAIKKLSEEI